MFLRKGFGKNFEKTLSTSVNYDPYIRHVAKKYYIVSIRCLRMHWAIFIKTFLSVLKHFD